VLVSRRLAEQGVAIDHLLADGGTRPHPRGSRKRCSPRMADPICSRIVLRGLARAYGLRERAMKRT